MKKWFVVFIFALCILQNAVLASSTPEGSEDGFGACPIFRLKMIVMGTFEGPPGTGDPAFIRALDELTPYFKRMASQRVLSTLLIPEKNNQINGEVMWQIATMELEGAQAFLRAMFAVRENAPGSG